MDKVRLICVSCFRDINSIQNCFSCTKNHHYCTDCAKSLHLKCECYEILHLNARNEYDPNKISCIGDSLNIWECNWSGKVIELKEHFSKDHSELELFSCLQVSSITFSEIQAVSSVTLIEALENQFVFYFYSCPAKEMLYFMIFLISESLEKFYYEFMVKVPSEDHCKIKFVENCYHYKDDVIRLRDNENCVAITFKSIRKHLFENKIHFSFLIKKKGKTSNLTVKSSNMNENKSSNSKQKSNKFPNSLSSKGILKSNITGGSSIPVPMANSPNSSSTQKTVNADKTELLPSDPPQYSSINRIYTGVRRPCLESPAVTTPSINRIDEQLQTQLSPGTPMHDYMHYNCPQSAVQPYKMNDTILYKQTYPKDCLSKPILKK